MSSGDSSDGSLFASSFWLFLGIIIILGIAARITYVLTVGHHIKLGLDATWYVLVGGGLAAGHGYSDPVSLLAHGIQRATANFPPGYPLVLAGLSKLGITTVTGFKLAGACIGGITILATGVLGRWVARRSSVGLIAAAVVAVSPSLIASDGSDMSESLAIPLTAVLLLAVWWAAKSKGIIRWLLAGALAGILALVRSEDLLLALLLLPSVILVGGSLSVLRRLAQIVVTLLVVALVVSPWVIRNHEAFHPSILISTAADKTVAGANCSATYRGPLIGYWEFDCLGHDRLAASHEARYGHDLEVEGLHYARTHFSRVPLVVTVRVLRSWGLFNPLQGARLAGLETRSVGWQQLAWPVLLVVLILSLPGLIALRRDRVALVLVAGPAVIDTLVVATSYGNERFVLSAIPGLAVAVGLTIVQVWDRARPEAAHIGNRARELRP